MPSEPEDEANKQRFLMDLDLDLDGSWPLDQIVGSPFFVPSSEHHQQQQPVSPLWAFSDDATNGGFRMLSYAHNPDLENGNAFDNDEKKKVPSPFVGLMPIENPDGSCLIKERMAQALRYFKDSTEQHVLAQVWSPVKHGGRCMLTTSGQPFVLDHNSNRLHQYRMVSQIFMFSVDGDTDLDLGLPGRVFRQKLPEWTPNVQYYTSKEFPRLNHALHYNVRGTLALPVFDPSGQTCLGVLELIMTSHMINCAPEVDKVCKALEAVNLKSSEILDHRSSQICNEGRQNALAEILEIITVVCETHTLPLAQTWVPCMHGSILANGGSFKKTCSSFDGSCKGQVCMSTTDVACYVVDAHVWGFRDACAEHHLQKGQGVAGRAFASRSSCFCHDITEFCKKQYPLVHYARMFGLRSSFAICLQSGFTGNDDYVLEFFLPSNVNSYQEQLALLDSILATMKQHFGSLRVASGKDLDQEWSSIEIFKASSAEKVDRRSGFVDSSPPRNVTVANEETPLHLDEGPNIKGELNDNYVKENACNAAGVNNNATSNAEIKDPVKKKPERKRGKAEKTISLEVLQQYFAGSLKDAAKSLGVCPTTMKRICRQHGISRWPSRKINKVNRSLSKLKRVIESVQGGEGSFSLTSLDANPIPGTVGSISWAPNINGVNPQSLSGQIPSEFLEDMKELDIARATEPNEQAKNSQLLNNTVLQGEGANRSRTRSGSREESLEMHGSQGSCQGTPYNGNKAFPENDRVVSPTIGEHKPQMGGFNELLHQEINLAAGFSVPDNLMATAEDERFRGMLLEDAGSSHDLRNLCPDTSVKDAQVARYDQNKFVDKSDLKIVTIKAAYGEDIIRFRLAVDAGIVSLREEVSKRLKLDLGTFDIKYLDDDTEWVLIACDADLHECIDLSKSLGSNMVRLLVHDINVTLGSSCESSGQ